MASIPECVRLFLGRKIACYLVGRPFTTMDKRSPSDVVQGTNGREVSIKACIKTPH